LRLEVRILITGSGIIGTIYGWALSESGHAVVHWVRPGKVSRLAAGVRMDVFDRRKDHARYFRGLYSLSVTEIVSPSDRYELVVVPTKHYQLADALRALAPAAGQADFLLLTQNWRGTEDVDSILPRSRYLYGDAKAGGAYREGTLVSAVAGIDIGPAEGPPTPLTERVAAIFSSADVATRVHGDMLHYLWIQYAILAGLWPALVRAGSMDASPRSKCRRDGNVSSARVFGSCGAARCRSSRVSGDATLPEVRRFPALAWDVDVQAGPPLQRVRQALLPACPGRSGRDQDVLR
jgi:2-dehydropantoate 2-reductase